MKYFLHKILPVAVCALATLSSVRAQTIVGLTSNNTLATFTGGSTTPTSQSPAITGLIGGDTIFAIDFRPIDTQLIGFGYNSTTGVAHVYSLNLSTGVAASINANTLNIGTGIAKPLADFNPTANAIRVTTSAATGNNLRIPGGGTGVLTPDTDLNPANAGILGSAYSRNQPGGGTSGATTLFLVSGTTLFSQGSIDFFTGSGTSPNSGMLNTIANLSNVTGTIVGFDIGYVANNTGTAYLATTNALYTLNVSTGAATLVGTTPGAVTLRDIAALPVPEPGTWALCALGAGLSGVVAFRRRSAKR